MKTYILEVADESKAGFVETLLSQLEGVAFKEKAKSKSQTKHKQKKQDVADEKRVSHVFARTIGMWKNRDVNGKDLRKKTWEGL